MAEERFSEAPFAFTARFVLHGFDCMITARDDTAENLFNIVDTIFGWLEEQQAEPVARVSASVKRASAGQETAQRPVCPTHKREMLQSKWGGWYCPEIVAEDNGTGKPVYCNYRIKK